MYQFLKGRRRSAHEGKSSATNFYHLFLRTLRPQSLKALRDKTAGPIYTNCIAKTSTQPQNRTQRLRNTGHYSAARPKTPKRTTPSSTTSSAVKPRSRPARFHNDRPSLVWVVQQFQQQMIKRRLGNTSRCKENEGAGGKPIKNELESQASMKLQELSEVDANVPEMCRTMNKRDWRCCDLSGWNEGGADDASGVTTPYRRDKLLGKWKASRTALNSANSTSRKNSSQRQRALFQMKSLQMKQRSQILPFTLAQTSDNYHTLRPDTSKLSSTLDPASTNLVSQCIYPLHIFDEFSHTNQMDVIKLRILKCFRKEKNLICKTPQFGYRKSRQVRPMTSSFPRPYQSVERAVSGVIRKHHAIRQMLKKRDNQKASASISKRYETQNKFAQYLYEKYDAVVNKLGCAALK